MKRLFRRKKPDTELNLSSLMDMFTIILFFFLSTYSFEGVVMNLAEGIDLPKSLSRIPVAEKHYLGIGRDKLVVNGLELRNNGADDTVVLNNLKKIKKGGANHLVIQADSGLPFYMVRNYIRLAVQAGFAKPYLAVLPK